MAVFELVIPSKYKASRRLAALRSAAKSNASTTTTPALLENDADYQNLVRQSEADKRENKDSQRRLSGKSVKYGDIVQLQHNYTNKFLSVNAKKTSKLSWESRVELRDDSDKSCFFKIMPLHEADAEGGFIYQGNTFHLQSVKRSGLKIALEHRISTDPTLYEASLSQTGSPFVVVLHRRFESKEFAIGKKAIHFGDTVCLHHRELDAHIQADDVFYENNNVDQATPYLRIRLDNKEEKESVLSYFQVESQEEPTSGEPLSWGKPIRLKHLASRKYLVLDGKGSVKNEDQSTGPDALPAALTTIVDRNVVFKMYSFKDSTGDVTTEAFGHFEHIETSCSLHGDKGSKGPAALRNAKKRSLSRDSKVDYLSIYDKHDAKYDLTSVRSVKSDDAFTVELVSRDEVMFCNKLMGLIPALLGFIRRRKQAESWEVNAAEAKLVMDTLSRLKDDLSQSNKKRVNQRIFRQFGLVNICLQMLQAPFKKVDQFIEDDFNPSGINIEQLKEHKALKDVLCGVYGVLSEFITGGSRKNLLTVAYNIPFFHWQAPYHINAEVMLMVLVKDDDEILDRIELPFIQNFIDSLVQEKTSSYLDFLSACAKRGRADIQSYILKNLIVEKEKAPVIARWKMEKDEQQQLLFIHPSEQEAAKVFDAMMPDQQQYIISSVKLVSNLCQGGNKHAIDELIKLKYINFDTCFTVLKEFEKSYEPAAPEPRDISEKKGIPETKDISMNSVIPEKKGICKMSALLCKQFVSLLTSAFVDVSSTRFLEKPLVVNSKSDVTKSQVYPWDILNHSSLLKAEFNKLLKWISKFLLKVTPDETGSNNSDAINEVLVSILKMVHVFVEAGCYNKEVDIDCNAPSLMDLQKIVTHHITMIAKKPANTQAKDSVDDVLFPVENEIDADENTTKLKPKDNTDEFFGITETGEDKIDYVALSENNKSALAVTYTLLKIIDSFIEIQSRNRVFSFLSTFSKAWTDGQKKATIRNKAYNGAISNLIVHLGRVDKKQLDTHGKTALTTFLRDGLDAKAPDTDFIKTLFECSRFDDWRMTHLCFSIINKLHTPTHRLLAATNDSYITVSGETQNVYEVLLKNYLPVLRSLSKKASYSKKVFLEVARIFDELKLLCHLKDDEDARHVVNQDLFHTVGLLDIVIDFMNRPLNSETTESDNSRSALYRSMFKFLQSLIRGHTLLQNEVFERLDMFLDFPICRPDMIRSLTSLFRDNQRLCMAIKESHIVKLVRLLAEYNTQIPNMLELLNYIVKIDSIDLPLKRNQTLVLRYMTMRRAKTLLLVEDDDNDKRIQLLVDCSENYWLDSKNGIAKEPEEHEYHWRLIRFLSSCAEGGNRNCVSTLQQIFSLNELYDVLLHDKIHIDLKRPYLRYLLWVYLDSNQVTTDTRISDIQSDKQFWRVLDMIADTLNKIADKDFSKPLEKHDSFFAFEAGATVPRKFFSEFFNSSQALENTVSDLKLHVDKISTAFLNFLSKMMAHPNRFTYHHKTLFSSALDAMYKAVMKNVDGNADKPDFHIAENYKDVESLMAGLSRVNDKQAAPFKNDVVEVYEKTHAQDLAVNILLDKAVKCLRQIYEEETSTKDMKDAHITGGEDFRHYISTILQEDTFAVSPYKRYTLDVQRVRDIVNKMNKSFAYSGKENKADTKSYIETDEALLKLLAAVIRIPQFPGPKNKSTRASDVKFLIQDHMCTAGVASVAVNFISTKHARGDDVNNASLLLLRDLLGEGNEKTQRALLDYFQSTSEESFFEDIRRRLTQRLDLLKELRTMKNQLIDDENRTRGNAVTLAPPVSATTDPQANVDDEHGKSILNLSDRLESFIAYEINRGMGAMSDSSKSNRNSIATEYIIGDMEPGPSESRSSTLRSDSAKGLLSSKDASRSMVTKPSFSAKPLAVPNNMKVKHIKESVMLANQEAESIKLLLQVMQSMVQGQDKDLKAYMRAQEDNVGRSVDLVKEVAAYLHDLYPSISLPTLPLVTELVATLRILCAGNSENQQIAFDNKVVEICNTVFRQKKPYPYCFFTELLALKVQMAGLLFTMVEHNDEKTKDLAPQVCAVVDKPLLLANMKFYAEHAQTLTLLHREKLIAKNDPLADEYAHDRKQFDDCKVTTLDAAAIFYSILARFNDLGLPAPVVEDDVVADISRGNLAFDTSRKARKALKKHKKKTKADTALAAFKSAMNSIEVVYDKELEKVYFPVHDGKALRTWMKEDIQYNVIRTSSPTDKVQDFLRRCETLRIMMDNESRYRQNSLIDFIARFTKVWNIGIVAVTFIMQLFMLVTWQGDPMDINETTPIEPYWLPTVLYALGAVHVICALFAFIDHLVKNVLSDTSSLRKRSGILLNLYYMMILGFSIGGFFRPQFYAFHLLHVVTNNKVLKNATRSITYNGRQLLFVGLLGIIVIYCFSMISFTWLRVSYEITDGMYCETLWQCFLTNILAGLLTGGGVSSRLGSLDSGWTSYVWGRYFYDLGFFIFIHVIGLNMIFGVIVDTFSQLRSEQNIIANDMREKCFICSLRSYDFDRRDKGGFHKHCRREHRMWNYLFFTIYLTDKKKTMYTSIEERVSALCKKDPYGTDWIPISRSITLADKKEHNEDILNMHQDVKLMLHHMENGVKEHQEMKEVRKDQVANWRRKEEHAAGRHTRGMRDKEGGAGKLAEADRAQEVEKLAETARKLGMDPEPFKLNNLVSDDIISGEPQTLSTKYNIPADLVVKLKEELRRS